MNVIKLRLESVFKTLPKHAVGFYTSIDPHSKKPGKLIAVFCCSNKKTGKQFFVFKHCTYAQSDLLRSKELAGSFGWFLT